MDSKHERRIGSSRLGVLRRLLLALVLGLPALAGVAPRPVGAAGTSTPVQAVSLLVKLNRPCWLHWSPPAGPHPPMTRGFLRTCALTPRFERQILRSGVGWDALCSCPAQLGRPYVTHQDTRQTSSSGRTASVAVRWYFGAIWYGNNVVVVHNTPGWQVDAISCIGARTSFGLCRPKIPSGFTPRGTASAIQAVGVVVAPFSRNGQVFGTCNPLSGMVYTCPITSRLLHTFLYNRSVPTFCRCQNPPTRTQIRRLDHTGLIAHLAVDWYFGGTKPLYTTTFVVRRGWTGWLVEDQYCAGRPSTSLLGRTPGPCT